MIVVVLGIWGAALVAFLAVWPRAMRGARAEERAMEQRELDRARRIAALEARHRQVGAAYSERAVRQFADDLEHVTNVHDINQKWRGK